MEVVEEDMVVVVVELLKKDGHQMVVEVQQDMLAVVDSMAVDSHRQ